MLYFFVRDEFKTSMFPGVLDTILEAPASASSSNEVEGGSFNGVEAGSFKDALGSALSSASSSNDVEGASFKDALGSDLSSSSRSEEEGEDDKQFLSLLLGSGLLDLEDLLASVLDCSFFDIEDDFPPLVQDFFS